MFIWDEAKRQSNLLKHGLDFVDAPLVFNAPDKVTLESPRQGEARWLDIALVEIHGVVLAMVYTLHGADIRVISLRRASLAERRIYESA